MGAIRWTCWADTSSSGSPKWWSFATPCSVFCSSPTVKFCSFLTKPFLPSKSGIPSCTGFWTGPSPGWSLGWLCYYRLAMFVEYTFFFSFSFLWIRVDIVFARHMVVTCICYTCYCWVFLMGPWCFRWTCLLLMQFTNYSWQATGDSKLHDGPVLQFASASASASFEFYKTIDMCAAGWMLIGHYAHQGELCILKQADLTVLLLEECSRTNH